MSAGTMSPTRMATTSPGTSCAVGTAVWTPSRQTSAVWRMPACRAATAFAARYSLTKPRPTLSTTMTAMIDGVGRIAGEARDAGRGQQEDQQRVAELADQDPQRRHPLHAQGVETDGAQASRRLRAAQPALVAPQPGEDDLRRQRPGIGDVEDGRSIAAGGGRARRSGGLRPARARRSHHRIVGRPSDITHRDVAAARAGRVIASVAEVRLRGARPPPATTQTAAPSIPAGLGPGAVPAPPAREEAGDEPESDPRGHARPRRTPA